MLLPADKQKRSLQPSNLGIDYGLNLQCAWGR